MAQWKWLLENKLTVLIVTALLGGLGTGATLLLDASYDRGCIKSRNECLNEIRTLEKNHLDDYRKYLLLQHRCEGADTAR